MNNDFFYRPFWQQYLICILFPIIAFLIGYLVLIEDIQNESIKQRALYQEQLQQIALSKLKIARYQAGKQHALRVINQNQLAYFIEKNQLVLNMFKYHQTDTGVRWEVGLKGNFSHFIHFLSELNNEYFYLDFESLTIANQETYLQIIFTLLFKKEKE